MVKFMNIILCVISALIPKHEIRVWWDRVCSDSNPADGVSRNDFQLADLIGARRVPLEAVNVSALEFLQTWLGISAPPAS